MSKLIDLTGKQFGTIKVLKRVEKPEGCKNNGAYYKCQCQSCKEITIKRGADINYAVKKGSKFCNTCSRLKHGHTSNYDVSRTYCSWQKMKARCYNPNVKAYKWYGGRGIEVCNRWKDDFQAFLKDMGIRPDNTTIDRIDSDKDYSPENCRWADPMTQRKNQRNPYTIYNRN